MTSVTPAAERIHLGMDVSRDTIAVAVLRPWENVPAVELISNDREMVRRPPATRPGQAAMSCTGC